MNRKLNTLFLLAISSLGFSSSANADIVRDQITVQGYPLRQYLLVMKGRESKLYRANLEQIPEGFYVSADLQPSADSMVAAVVELNDGSVVSSALHKVGDELLLEQSSVLAQQKIADLESEVKKSGAEVRELEHKIEQQNTKLRAKAGLDDVDRIYKRIEELDREIDTAQSNAVDLN